MSSESLHEVVHVHVVNAHEMIPAEKPEKAETVRHVITRTFTDINTVVELLQLDPLRVKTEIFISGAGTVYICHSQAQAQAALTGTGGNFGAQIVCPGANTGSVRYTDYSQAKLWAVLTGASPVISLISEKKS
jgi:hypothetical protein